jgi:hypothetical protein
MLANLLLSTLIAVPGAPAAQWVTSCPVATPEQERLTEAAAKGDVAAVTVYLNSGAEVDAVWRDLPSPSLCQSLLLRSLFNGQDLVFQLLLRRGADPLKLPTESLKIPVGAGNVEMARTLFARGLKPHNAYELVNAALTNDGNNTKSIPMLQLLAEAGVPVGASTVHPYFLTDNVELLRFVVPKYIKPNDEVGLGLEQCAVQKVLGLFSEDQDGCEGARGPLWLRFVVTGRHRAVEYMIEHGADLTRCSEVWDNGNIRPFSAMDVAVRRKDKQMIDLLRRAGATERIYR